MKIAWIFFVIGAYFFPVSLLFRKSLFIPHPWGGGYGQNIDHFKNEVHEMSYMTWLEYGPATILYIFELVIITILSNFPK